MTLEYENLVGILSCWEVREIGADKEMNQMGRRRRRRLVFVSAKSIEMSARSDVTGRVFITN